jgi:hypothetical protein
MKKAGEQAHHANGEEAVGSVVAEQQSEHTN